jgi:hypothetical protein
MKAKQVSVFVENKPGRLVAVLRALEDRGISIKGMSVADAADIGIVRLVVSDPDDALMELQDRGFTARADYVVCAEIKDVPGGLLHGVAEPIAAAGINLRYFYAYTEPSTGGVIAVIKADDSERAEAALRGGGKDPPPKE